MRKENMCVSERVLMFAVGGQLFAQAPNKQPRNAEVIMTKVRDAFRKVAHNSNEYYTLVIEEDKLKNFIKEVLFSISEFKDLNLSQIEVDKNVNVDDESRPKFSFSSAYDKETPESWKSDFIDLDAFVQNVLCNIYNNEFINTDCFGCASSGKEICNSCNINPKLKNNYVGWKKPKGEFTFACKYDCFEHKYICCEECDKKDTCPNKCDSKSRDCGLAINYRPKDNEEVKENGTK